MATQITYATMSADNEELHAAYERGIEIARGWLGQDHPFYVSGRPRHGEGWYEEYSPIDQQLLIGRYSQATVADLNDAVAAALEYQPTWAATPWRERVAIIRRLGDVLDEQTPELAALLAFEVGKNRLEALGDVAETAEFCRYYAHQMEQHNGFVTPLGKLSPNEDNASVLRPYGVWAVISPFNFPMALAGGPSTAALLTGNTVVLKPSNAGALTGLKLYEAMMTAGVPTGAMQIVTGAGAVVGRALAEHQHVAGITFTGSYEVGMGIYKGFAKTMPKPAVCEMGGKNPVVVSAKADLDLAAEGTMRAAFGFSGQKCSAASRVYVERRAFDRFVELLVEKTRKLQLGDPIERGTFVGPVIDRKAVARFAEAVEEVRAKGGDVLIGGSSVGEGDLGRGTFVEPTVVTVPFDSWVWSRELFVPLVVVGPVDSVEEGIRRANDTEYGLTAGFYSMDESEINRFFDSIEAGVTYVNRRAGATTGAWPNIQAFGGWKASGTSGTGGGGPWYLLQYLREQSRTRVR